MKSIRIFLLVLIIMGIGLLFTKDRWVPKVVDILIARDHTPPPFVLERPAKSTTTPVTHGTLPYGEVTLKTGETVKFADLTITLTRVFDDSRCPTGVTCIWAGTVKAEVKVSSGLGVSTSTIELGKSITTEAEEITFVSATPYPKEGTVVPSGEYRLTFRVEKRP